MFWHPRYWAIIIGKTSRDFPSLISFLPSITEVLQWKTNTRSLQLTLSHSITSYQSTSDPPFKFLEKLLWRKDVKTNCKSSEKISSSDMPTSESSIKYLVTLFSFLSVIPCQFTAGKARKIYEHFEWNWWADIFVEIQLKSFVFSISTSRMCLIDCK